MLCIASVHADTLRVGVIDTGLDITDNRFTAHLCETGHKDFTGKGLDDNLGHGTHVAGIIEEWAKDADYCLVILKYYNSATDRDYPQQALEEAINQHLDIVNLSFTGTEFHEAEKDIICDNPSTLFFAAAGNDHKNIDINPDKDVKPEDNQPHYPASLRCNNLYAVGAYDYDGSDYGKSIDIWEEGNMILSFLPYKQKGRMSGTSMATPAATGKWVYLMSHWDN